MNPIESILDLYPVLVIDGALATELERRGCDLKDELWSAKVLLKQPEKIKQVHYDYFQTGADCAITASYQAAIEGFTKRGLSEQEALALIQKSVRLAIEARDEIWANRQTRQGEPGPLSPLPWDPMAPSWPMDRGETSAPGPVYGIRRQLDQLRAAGLEGSRQFGPDPQ